MPLFCRYAFIEGTNADCSTAALSENVYSPSSLTTSTWSYGVLSASGGLFPSVTLTMPANGLTRMFGHFCQDVFMGMLYM